MIPFMKSFYCYLYCTQGPIWPLPPIILKYLLAILEVCPFMCTQEKKNRGFVTDIAEAVFTTAGYKVNFWLYLGLEQFLILIQEKPTRLYQLRSLKLPV